MRVQYTQVFAFHAGIIGLKCSDMDTIRRFINACVQVWYGYSGRSTKAERFKYDCFILPPELKESRCNYEIL